MHLTGFEIYNFQSHVDTVKELKDGLNGFVGTSDSGKSAILRALKWNLLNTPSGDEFIRKGTNEATVVTHWSDGHSVTRRRSTGSINTYALSKDGIVLQEFTGFGGKVPPMILEVTGIDPNFSFNFANQLEAPFLLSESPKVRAETIGNLEELGKIDSELTKLNEDVRGKKQEQRSEQARLKSLESEKQTLVSEISADKEKMETLLFLKEAIVEKQRTFNVLEQSKNRILDLESELTELKQVISKAERVLAGWQEDLPERFGNFSRLESIVVRIISLRSELETIRYINSDTLDRLIELSALVSEVTTSYHRLVQLKDQVERNQSETIRLQGSYSTKAASLDMKKTDTEVERFMAIFSRNKRLLEIKEIERGLSQEITQSTKELDSLLTQFVDALQAAKTCPICFQTTDDINKHELEHSI